MTEGRKGTLDTNTAQMVRNLFDESKKATGRTRVRDVENLLASMKGKHPTLSRDPSFFLDWAKKELPKGRFEGIPWFFLGMGKYFETLGNWNDAEEWYRIASDRSEQRGYRGIHLDSIISNAHLLAKKGGGKEAGRLYRCAFREAQGCRDYVAMMRALGGMGALHFDEGAHFKAREAWRKVLLLSEKAGEHQWKAHVLNDMGALFGADGSFGRALNSLESARIIYESFGYERGIARCLHNIAFVHLETGRLDLAGKFFSASQKITDSLSWEELSVMNLLGRTEVLIRVNELDTALPLSTRALERAAELQDPFSQVEANSQLSSILYAKGDRDGSLNLMESCFAKVKQMKSSYTLARVLEARVRMMLSQGDTSCALADLKKLASLYRKMGIRAKARKTEAIWKKIKERGG